MTALTEEINLFIASDVPRDLIPADPYFSVEYGAAAAVQDDGVWMMATWRDGAVMVPVIVRDIQGATSLQDVCSPYGYGGPYIAPSLPDADVHAFETAWHEALLEWGVVSEFTRFSPWSSDATRLAKDSQHLEIRSAGVVRAISLAGTDDEILSRYESRTRTKVRKGIRSGLEVRIREQADIHDECWMQFVELYAETMDRVEASSYYRFSDAYWDALRRMPNLMLVELQHEGATVYAGLLMYAGKRAHLHLTASTAGAGRLGAGPLFYHSSAGAMAARGCDWLHIGGGLSEDDSLDYFKRGFTAESWTFSIGRRIVSMADYETLSQGTDAGEFFPAYRMRH